MTAAYLYDAVRAPFGRFNGETYGIGRDDLAETGGGEVVSHVA